MKSRFLLLIILLLCAGCNQVLPPKASRSPEFGQLLLDEKFNTSSDWDEYNLQGAVLQVRDSAYHITASISNYVYGENTASYDNVIVEASAYLLSDYSKAIYGVMCRANRGRGYYFVISADGNFSIRRADEHSADALVPWQDSSAIHTGTRENILRAVCSGDYLAFYINGEFVAETNDTRYHQGAVGLTAALPQSPAAGAVSDVVFDNVKVWAAP